MTGRAARFMQLLHDFGHVDYDDLNRLLLGVGDVVTDDKRVVDIDEVRRAAAMWLFPEGDSEDTLSGLLGEDWPILFS